MAINTIPFETAKNWAAKWQSDPANKIKAFLIPKVDITQLFEFEGVCNVRTYFGIDKTGAQKLVFIKSLALTKSISPIFAKGFIPALLITKIDLRKFVFYYNNFLTKKYLFFQMFNFTNYFSVSRSVMLIHTKTN